MIYVTDDLQVTPASTTGQPSPVNSWQWRRNGQSIENAVASTYRLTDADVGQSITVTQTASNLIGKAYAESAAVNPLAFDPIALYRNNEQGAWYDPSDFDRYMTQFGPELVTNGDFSNGTTGWSVGTGNASLNIVNGVLRLTATDTATSYTFTQISVVAGRGYLFKASSTFSSSSTAAIIIGTTQGSTDIFNSGGSASAFSVDKYIVATTSGTWYIGLRVGNTVGGYSEYDNISVKELTAISTATMFQDASGTTPVTAMEQPVGLILDKRKGLVLGSEQKSNGVIGIVGTLASPAIYNTTTGTGSVNRVSFPGEQSFISFSGLTANSIYRMNFSALGGVGLTLRTGNQSNAGVSIFAASSVFVQASALGVITITAAANGTATFTLDSIRELPGNHAFQTTSTSRPVLSARYNLLTKTEQFDDAAWVKGSTNITANATTAPNGTMTADKFIPTAGAVGATVAQSISVSVAVYTFTFRAKAAEQSVISLVSNLTGTFRANVFNLSAQTVSPGTGWTASITPDPAGNGWFVCSCSATADTAALKVFQISNNSVGWTGDGTSGIYIWGADLRVTNDALNQPAYQLVNTATDYDSTGFKPYLRFDGTDDWLQTNSVDFTATDKMTVFAGVRKLSDAAAGVVAELSINSGVNNSTFALFAPGNPAPNYTFRSRGTLDSAPTASPFASPITSIITGLGDIAADVAIIRVDGTQAASASVDQGTGNYGNYPLYIGRRGGTTLPFNGRLYGLIIRGATTKSEAIVKTEQYMAGKTGNQL